MAFVPHLALLAIKGVEFLPLAGMDNEQPVEVHAIWPGKVSNPALRRLLQDLDIRTK